MFSSETYKILNILKNRGYEAYIVGGAVRDYCMGRTPCDIDLCTNALPEEMLDCFNDFKVIPTGLKHGTVTVICNHQHFEITTYRVEKNYFDHRHPVVSFSSSLKDDLSRRDFTINAMAYDDKLIDYFQGLDDLQNKLIRTVNDARERFNEDSLRIMRALRFASTLDFTIEEGTRKALFSKYQDLKYISMERINSEFSKMIVGVGFTKVFKEYYEVFSFIIPELRYFDSEEIDTMINRISNCNDSLTIRLAIILYSIVKTNKDSTINSVSGILKRMKYSNKIITRVKTILSYCDFNLTLNRIQLKRILINVGIECFFEILDFQKILYNNFEVWNEIEKMALTIIENNEMISINDLAINGKDLIDAGVTEGPKVGQIIKQLYDDVINEKIENEKSQLLNQTLFYLTTISKL